MDSQPANKEFIPSLVKLLSVATRGIEFDSANNKFDISADMLQDIRKLLNDVITNSSNLNLIKNPDISVLGFREKLNLPDLLTRGDIRMAYLYILTNSFTDNNLINRFEIWINEQKDNYFPVNVNLDREFNIFENDYHRNLDINQVKLDKDQLFSLFYRYRRSKDLDTLLEILKDPLLSDKCYPKILVEFIIQFLPLSEEWNELKRDGLAMTLIHSKIPYFMQKCHMENTIENLRQLYENDLVKCYLGMDSKVDNFGFNIDDDCMRFISAYVECEYKYKQILSRGSVATSPINAVELYHNYRTQVCNQAFEEVSKSITTVKTSSMQEYMQFTIRKNLGTKIEPEIQNLHTVSSKLSKPYAAEFVRQFNPTIEQLIELSKEGLLDTLITAKGVAAIQLIKNEENLTNEQMYHILNSLKKTNQRERFGSLSEPNQEAHVKSYIIRQIINNCKYQQLQH
jgi:hypothetical protein